MTIARLLHACLLIKIQCSRASTWRQVSRPIAADFTHPMKIGCSRCFREEVDVSTVSFDQIKLLPSDRDRAAFEGTKIGRSSWRHVAIGERFDHGHLKFKSRMCCDFDRVDSGPRDRRHVIVADQIRRLPCIHIACTLRG